MIDKKGNPSFHKILKNLLNQLGFKTEPDYCKHNTLYSSGMVIY